MPTGEVTRTRDIAADAERLFGMLDGEVNGIQYLHATKGAVIVPMIQLAYSTEIFVMLVESCLMANAPACKERIVSKKWCKSRTWNLNLFAPAFPSNNGTVKIP